jgi:dihydroorotase-like cyclic amidohydrolase
MKMVKRSQSWFVEKNGSCVDPEGRKERKYLERNGKIKSWETSLESKEREKRSEADGGRATRLYASGVS